MGINSHSNFVASPCAYHYSHKNEVILLTPILKTSIVFSDDLEMRHYYEKYNSKAQSR